MCTHHQSDAHHDGSRASDEGSLTSNLGNLHGDGLGDHGVAHLLNAGWGWGSQLASWQPGGEERRQAQHHQQQWRKLGCWDSHCTNLATNRGALTDAPVALRTPTAEEAENATEVAMIETGCWAGGTEVEVVGLRGCNRELPKLKLEDNSISHSRWQ